MTGRRDWQELSLLDLTVEQEKAFMAAIASIPRGRRFSVNDIRARLDAIPVVERHRGGLFNRAIAAGLIEPVRITAWGSAYDVWVRSTGKSAHNSSVRLYRRLGGPDETSAPVEGGPS